MSNWVLTGGANKTKKGEGKDEKRVIKSLPALYQCK